MADVTVKVLEPAASHALITIAELKLALGISDSSQDAQLQMMIDQYSRRDCDHVQAGIC